MKKRVRIPVRDVKELLDLAIKVREKHLADGDGSPLKVLNWAAFNPLIDEAISYEEMAQALKRQKLKVFQQRNRRVEAVKSMLRNSRDLLAAVHSVEMKMLGEWGFEVLENRVTKAIEDEPAPTKG